AAAVAQGFPFLLVHLGEGLAFPEGSDFVSHGSYIGRGLKTGQSMPPADGCQGRAVERKGGQRTRRVVGRSTPRVGRRTSVHTHLAAGKAPTALRHAPCKRRSVDTVLPLTEQAPVRGRRADRI